MAAMMRDVCMYLDRVHVRRAGLPALMDAAAQEFKGEGTIDPDSPPP